MNPELHKWLRLFVTLAVLTLVAWWINGANRYSAVTGGDGTVYRLDRQTGKTWLLVVNREIPVEAGRMPTR